MEAVRVLAEEIGPRPACSAEEGRAAKWCAAELSALGHDVDIETFESRRGYHLIFAAYLLPSLLGASILHVAPLASAVLGIISLVLYARDGDGRPLVRPRGGESHNVIARSASGAPKIVFLAHVDSARSSLSFHPALVGNIRASVVALNAALVLVPAVGAAAWILEPGRSEGPPLWILGVPLSLYLLFAAGLLLHGHLRGVFVPGANDNASGVEVVMRLADGWDGPPAWFVITGSEEVGMIGARAFSVRHASDIARAVIVNVDSVGGGTVIAAAAEGIVRERRPKGALLDMAEAAGAKTRAFRGMPTDATVLLAHKRDAISLLAVDERGVIPNWHRPSDGLENVEPAVIDEAEAIVRRLTAAVLSEPSAAEQ